MPTPVPETLDRCLSALAAVPAVRALAVTGSGADGAGVDRWSDLDLVVVVNDADLPRFADGLDWLVPLGDVYAVTASPGPDHHTVRVCFADLRRVDFLLVGRSRLGAFAAAPGPLQEGARVVLDRSGGAVEAALASVPPAPNPGVDPDGADAAFRQLERDFRWNGVLAAVKVGRGDLLIGAHLALEMAQSCLVLGMLLRDREAGTRHHRYGDGAAPPLRLPAILTAQGVTELIAAAAACWADLGARWDPAYAFPMAPLNALLRQIPGGGKEASLP